MVTKWVVLRGAAWQLVGDFFRSGYRLTPPASAGSRSLGVRCVRRGISQ